jgi:hypothetical protein
VSNTAALFPLLELRYCGLFYFPFGFFEPVFRLLPTGLPTHLGKFPDSVAYHHLSRVGACAPLPCGQPAGSVPEGTGTSRPLLFGLAPDEVCRAAAVAGGAVGSYPAFSPLPGGLTFPGRSTRSPLAGFGYA